MIPPKIISQYFLTILEKDMTLEGSVVPKGTTVLFAPQTTAHSVRVPGGKSLLEAWEELSKQGHRHYDLDNLLADHQAEQIKALDRITRLELWAASNGFAPEDFSAPSKDITQISLYDYNYHNLEPDITNNNE